MASRRTAHAVIVWLAATSAGCSTRPDDPAKAELAADEVEVTPVELFRGDTERIAPHLGFAGWAAVKVDFKGGKLPIHLQVIVRHKGKVVRTQDLHSTKLDKPTEITFTLKEVPNPSADALVRAEAPLKAGETAFLATVDGGMGTSNSWFKRVLKNEDVGMSVSRVASQSAKLKRGEDLDIWAFYSDKGIINMAKGESFEEVAERVEWSMLLRLFLRERKIDP